MFGPWKCLSCGAIYRGWVQDCPCCDSTEAEEATITELMVAWFGGGTEEEGE